MSIAPDTFLHKWSAQEFYHLIRYRAWKSHAQNEYQKLITAKINAK